MRMNTTVPLMLLAAAALLARREAQAVSIGTNFGRGADAEIANDQVANDPITGQPVNDPNQFFADAARGTLNSTIVRMQPDGAGSGAVIRHRVTLLRFDLTGLSGDLSEASLELHSTTQGRPVDIFALNDSAEAGYEDWVESAITYNTAPGFQDLDPLPTNYVALDPSKVTSIGTWGIPAGSGATIAASRLAPTEGPEPGYAYDSNIAATFSVNLSAAVAADTNNLLTLFLVRSGGTNPASTGAMGNVVLLTKEGLAADQAASPAVGYTIAPSLVLPNATLPEPGGLLGDYNGDNTVDAADYVVWRNNVGAETLLNRDENITGPVGVEDYAVWKANFGESLGPGGAGAIGSVVPEPATILLLVAVLLFGTGQGRRR